MGVAVWDRADVKRNPISTRPKSEVYVTLQTKRHHPPIPPRAPLYFVTPSRSIGSRQAWRDRSTRLGHTQYSPGNINIRAIPSCKACSTSTQISSTTKTECRSYQGTRMIPSNNVARHKAWVLHHIMRSAIKGEQCCCRLRTPRRYEADAMLDLAGYCTMVTWHPLGTRSLLHLLVLGWINLTPSGHGRAPQINPSPLSRFSSNFSTLGASADTRIKYQSVST
jgi:hypothetical protein